MKTSVNEVTGNTEVSFASTLQSMQENSEVTSNGKNFKVCGIKFRNHDGETINASAICNEGNYQYGMEVGKSYLTKAVITPGRDEPLIVISHLEQSPRAKYSDFGINMSTGELQEAGETVTASEAANTEEDEEDEF